MRIFGGLGLANKVGWLHQIMLGVRYSGQLGCRDCLADLYHDVLFQLPSLHGPLALAGLVLPLRNNQMILFPSELLPFENQTALSLDHFI